MITLLILLLITGIGFLLPKDDFGSIGIGQFMVWTIAAVGILIHLMLWLPVSIEFNGFKARHDQLKIDLEISRDFDDSYERMAILQEITVHNQTIAYNKELNKNWFMDQYIDDRVEQLEMIK